MARREAEAGGPIGPIVLVAAAAGAGLLLFVLVRARLWSPPNLVLLTIDTLRADHLGCYEYPRKTSPSIDRLAAAGTLFQQARVQWPKTNASVASLLTSTYGSTNGVKGPAALLDQRLVTLAEMLAEAGYYCAAFVANAHLGRAFHFDQGFAEVHELWDNRWMVHSTTIGSAPFANERIAAEVGAWLAANRQRRFFLWVHFLDPHGPYRPPAALADRFRADRLYRSQGQEVPGDLVPGWIRDEGSKTVGDYVANYDGEIASTDAAVGEIVGELERLGLEGRSLVVLTADHGESLGEHGYFFQHGRFLYDDCLRVPLILRLPGRIPAGRRLGTQVGLIDLVPTVLQLLGMDASEYEDQLEGRSFYHLLVGSPDEGEERTVFSEAAGGQLAAVRGKWKLVHDPKGAGYQLFDLSADAAEEKNWARRYPSVAGGLGRALDRWRQERGRPGSYRSARVPRSKLDPAVRRQLETLGYLER